MSTIPEGCRAGCVCGHGGGLCTSSVSIFQGLSQEDQQSLVRIARHVDISKGQTLYHAGDPADRIIVLRYGRLKLSRLNAEGGELLLGILKQGEVMGEDSLYTGTRYDADLIAMEDLGVCLISSEAVSQLVLKRPALGISLLNSLGRKLHEARVLNEILTRRQATARLAGFLLSSLITQQEPVLQLGREEIAASIGLRRETVSRALGQLAGLQCIRLQGYRRIELIDAGMLRTVFENDAVL